MSAKQTVITITHGNESLQTAKDLLLKPSSKPRQAMVWLSRFFGSVSLGNRQAKIAVSVNTGDAVAATGTITFSSLVATDTFTIGTEVFTCEASGATGHNQFNVGGTDALSAAAAVAVINGNPNLSNVVTASNVGAVITVTAAQPGLIGNQIPIAISAHGSVSAAKLAGGAAPTTTSTTSTFKCGVS